MESENSLLQINPDDLTPLGGEVKHLQGDDDKQYHVYDFVHRISGSIYSLKLRAKSTEPEGHEAARRRLIAVKGKRERL